MAINVPLALPLCVPWVLIDCAFMFINFQKYFNFLPFFLQWPTDLRAMCCSVSRSLSIFFSFFGCWTQVLFCCGQTVLQELISIFLYLLRLVLCPKIFWRKFHGMLRKMYGVLLLEEIFCRCLSSPFDL
jgi:hypothetical protein